MPVAPDFSRRKQTTILSDRFYEDKHSLHIQVEINSQKYKNRDLKKNSINFSFICLCQTRIVIACLNTSKEFVVKSVTFNRSVNRAQVLVHGTCVF